MRFHNPKEAEEAIKKEALRKEAKAFAAYRASEEAKKFKVRDKFGFSRYATLEQAEAFATTLVDAEIIKL